MRRRLFFAFLSIVFICLAHSVPGYALPGDANGDGVVDIEDARTIARFVANEIPSIPRPMDADATQDGKADMEDAFIIAKKVTGETRIVVAAPRYGRSDKLQIGSIIRIEVFENFFPLNIKGGSVQITSVTTGYDSGDRPLTFERDGRSLYYHWDTSGLSQASDYSIAVNLY